MAFSEGSNSAAAFACKCKNIEVVGTPHNVNDFSPADSFLSRKKLNPDTDVVSIEPNSITIADKNHTNISMNGNGQAKVRCERCNQELTLSEYRGIYFTQLSQNSHPVKSQRRSFSMANGQSRLLPDNMTRLFKDNSKMLHKDIFPDDDDNAVPEIIDESKDFQEEEDFDLMFSATTDPFVGSFTQNSRMISV